MVAEAVPNGVWEVLEEIHSQLSEQEVRRPVPSPPPLQEAIPGNLLEEYHAPPEYQAIVDEALQLVYSMHHRILSRLYPQAMTIISLQELRQGPLGEDMARLALIAAGVMRAGRNEVLGAIDAVLQLLFWPVGSETYIVPRSFWEQPLGKLLSLAKLRCFSPGDLLSVGEAASILNVTRPTIYRWMDDKSLDYVRDDMTGQTFIVREDVEAMKADIDADAPSLSPKGDVNDPPQGHDEANADETSPLAPASAMEIPVQQSLIALTHRLNKLVHQEILTKTRQAPQGPTTSGDAGQVALRINEEPLTAKTVHATLGALTGLHTKLWLTHAGRFADLIDFTQTRDARLVAEANLIITRVSYNSPFSMNIDPGKLGDAMRESIDAVVRIDLRRKELKANIASAEADIRIKEEAARAAIADQDQARRIAAEEATIRLQREKVALQRDRAELLKYQMEMLPLLMNTAMEMVAIARPDVSESGQKEMLARTYLPDLLQLAGVEGVEQISFSAKVVSDTDPKRTQTHRHA